MLRREFVLFGAAALAVGLLPQSGAAQNAGDKLMENENFLKERQRLRLKIGGQRVTIDHVVLMLGGTSYLVDMRQPSPEKNEAKLDLSGLGGLTSAPIGKQIKRGRAVGDIYVMGRTLVIPVASAEDIPDTTRAIIPLPYPKAKTSLRPGGSFRKAKLKGLPSVEAVQSQGRKVGTAVLVKDGLALAMPSAGT